MQFLRKRKRTPPAIIIVSLIDVLIVVLIFLMVTTTFRKQAAVDIALPESKQAKPGAGESEWMIVTIEKKGPLHLGSEPVSFETLQQRLTAAVQKNPETKLSIRADTEATFGQIVRVMDAAKASGVKAVNAFTRIAK